MTSSDATLRSGVLTSPADAMLGRAIAEALATPAAQRADRLDALLRAIETWMAAHPAERPWVCQRYTGTDGSAVFRGGVGHSLVVDPQGRLWRARSYEDFATTYRFGPGTCEIDTLTPLYAQMREYQPRDR